MKWVTVQEYAKEHGITKAGAYKRIKLGTAISEKKFGKIVIRLNGKKK